MEVLTPLQKRGRKLVAALRGQAGGETPAMRRPDPRIGVALGSGSARGLIHIAYLEAIDELGLRPAVISGCSIGALIGAGWAAGMTGRELRGHSFEVLKTMRVIAGRIWATHVGGGITNIFTRGIPLALDATRVVDSFTPAGFPREFAELKVPMYIVATDFQSWHQAVFNTGLLREAIAGSISIPSLFRPVSYANHLLVDGGVVNPLPLDQIAADSDITIGIDVNGDPSASLTRTNHGALDVWFGAAQIMMHSLIAHMMAAYPPDIYVRPHVNHFGALEFWRVKEIVEHADGEKDRFKRMVADRIELFSAEQQRMLSAVHPIAPRRGPK
jgi:NTE family protein